MEEVNIVPINPDNQEFVRIGSLLQPNENDQLLNLLQINRDVFAWKPEDMTGVQPEVICHHLNIDPSKKPVKQKKRNVAPERNQVIESEIEKLIKLDFIKEVHYPEWLANVVLVKKKNGKWRFCIDFTYLNKACPKDSFPLPKIDSLVDSTVGHQLMSFMDAYSGYNQIQM